MRVTNTRLSEFLLVVVFLLYPFHFYMDFGLGSFNLSYGDPIIAIVGLLWLAGVFGRRALPIYILPIIAFLIAILLSILSVIMADPIYFQISGSLAEIAKLLGAIAWMVAIFVLGRVVERGSLKNAVVLLCLAGIVFAALSFYTTIMTEARRPMWPFENPNILSNFFILCLALSFYARDSPFLQSHDKLSPMFVTLSGLIFSLAVINSGSRGGIIALASFFAALIGIALARQRINLLQLVAGVGAAVVGTGLLSVLNPWVFGRLLESRTVEIRLEMWQTALSGFSNEPILGLGYGQARYYLAETINEQRSVHNTFISVLVETGVVGFVFFTLIFIVVARTVYVNRNSAIVYVAAFVIAVLTQGIATNVETFRSLWLAIGIIAVYSQPHLTTGVVTRTFTQVRQRYFH